MSTARSHEVPSQLPDPPPDVTVVCWPLRDAPLRSVTMLVAIFMAAVACGWFSHSAAMGGLVLVVLWIALWRLWIPVTYHLGTGGVVEKVFARRRRLDWLSVGRADLQTGGILLVANQPKGPVAALHGVFIPWRHKREEILALVDHFVSARLQPGLPRSMKTTHMDNR